MALAKINYTLAAGLIGAGASTEQVAERFGVQTDTLRKGLRRHNSPVTGLRSQESLILKAEDALVSALARQSESTRRSLGVGLTAAASRLEKPGKSVQKWVRVAEPVARTAKLVFGWGETASAPLVAIHDLHLHQSAALPEPAQAVEVEAQVEPALETTPEPTAEPNPS